MMHARDHDWFRKNTAKLFSKARYSDFDYNLFNHDESYPIEIRLLNKYHQVFEVFVQKIFLKLSGSSDG